MADEVGPVAAEDLLVGALPERLHEVFLTHAELARAAAPWLSGDVHVPLAQLKELADWAKAMQAVCGSVVAEARVVHRQTVERRRASV